LESILLKSFSASQYYYLSGDFMGILDSILGKEETGSSTPSASSGKSANPFAVTLSFAPLRLAANKASSVSLVVKVKNISADPQIVSVDALLPKEVMVGFDPACINKAVEKRVGEMKSGETKDVQILVWSNNQTKEGTYPVDVTVFAHYIGYDKVMSYIKKNTTLRAV
jgi:uncharacterized membrane protein